MPRVFVAGRCLFPLLVVACFCCIWLNIVWLPLSPVTPDLDLSWCGALINFSARGLQYGRDIIFTYGPLGHLMAFVYTGELFTARVVWEFASKTASACLLTWTVLRLPIVWRLPFFLFFLFFIWADPIADALHFLVMICVAALLFTRRAIQPLLIIGIAGLLAVCSLNKFTYFLLALFVILLALGWYCTRRNYSAAVILGGAFLVSFLATWKSAGQHFSTLPAYLQMSWEICLGYKEAMSTAAQTNAVVVLGCVALVLAITVCALLFFQSPSWQRLFPSLFFAGAIFLSWNRAFVRADDHVLSFFALCPIALLVVWTVADANRVTKRVGYSINAFVFVFCLWGIWLQKPSLLATAFDDMSARFRGAWAVLTDTPGIKHQLDDQLAAAKRTYALPRVHNEVRDQTIDVFGYEQGIALLNDLNYTPRLVFQSYSAYTPRLIHANSACYHPSRAPAYVLMKYQPIDNRFPALEDAGVLREILGAYTFLFEENGYLLWKRTHASPEAASKPSDVQVVRLGTEVSLPMKGRVWIEVDVRPSLLGSVRAAVYKPPQVEIRTTDSLGGKFRHRLIPSMSSSGFLISPEIFNTEQLLRTAAGRSDAAIVSFSVNVQKPYRRFFANRITCRMYTLPAFSYQAPQSQSLSVTNLRAE